MTLEAWLVTDVGVVRDHNEDSAHMETAEGFFIVADGMGGHAAGEVASAMTVDSVRKTLLAARPEIEAFKKAPSDTGRRALVQLLQNAVLSAHQAVFQRGQAEPDKAGMGTTLDVVLIAGPEAFVAHVGDSRTYLIRDSKPSQVTTDHTVAEVLVIEGKLTVEEAQVSPLRTILVNAIGVSADVGVEMAHVQLRRGDRILLCSDGLHDYFPVDEEIGQRLGADNVGDAIAEMVELAKTRGGHDNITGIAIQIANVVDAVPTTVEGESTQPVESVSAGASAASTFGADEPTETAFVPPPGVPPRIGATPPAGIAAVDAGNGVPRSTQPMRALSDERPVARVAAAATAVSTGAGNLARHEIGVAETWPPPGVTQKPAGSPDVDDQAPTAVMSAVTPAPAEAATASTGADADASDDPDAHSDTVTTPAPPDAKSDDTDAPAKP